MRIIRFLRTILMILVILSIIISINGIIYIVRESTDIEEELLDDNETTYNITDDDFEL